MVISKKKKQEKVKNASNEKLVELSKKLDIPLEELIKRIVDIV